MRVIVLSGIVLGLGSAPAWAEDKPVIAPTPAWVKPVAIPANTAKPDDAPVKLLLFDQQSDLQPSGQTEYVDYVMKIQTPQGLTAGNVSVAWRPETDVLTVHRLQIRRGDQTIDVLASGQTFTVVRRETNLENATLDGVLTANIQPEGLQVGDTLEFAYSVRLSDPTLQGHVETISAINGTIPVFRAHRRMQWPNSVTMRMRQDTGLSFAKPVKSGGVTVVEGTFDNVQPYAAPKGAPQRFLNIPVIELTDFKSWNDMGVLLAPLYEKAATLPATGPLRVEVDKILAASTDPNARAQAALNLVQDRIRYVALLLGVGGLVPTDAATTWARRYGDCKAKTALLLAILKEAGVDAVPVVVNANSGDGFDQRLPLIRLFNHILVRATIAGKTYWLDGTRIGDTSIDRLTIPNFGWGVPIVAAGSPLVQIVPAPLAEPTYVTTIKMDATAGLAVPAPTMVETVIGGDEAIGINLAIANLVGDARNLALRDYWKKQYDFIEPKTTSASFDPKTGQIRLSMTGDAKMDWSSGYEMDGASVGYKADFSRPPGPKQDAPFAVAYPVYNKTVETILLPPGFNNVKFGDGVNVDATVAGISYRRNLAIAGNVITMERTERTVASEFPFKDAAAAQTALRDLADTRVFIPKPSNYAPSEREVALAVSVTPTNRRQWFDRGLLLLNANRLDEAIADFDRAEALDPRDAWTLANRAMAYAQKGQFEKAAKDAAAAEGIDPRISVTMAAQGVIAESKNDTTGAIAAYSKAVELDPTYTFALHRRARLRLRDGDFPGAIADASAMIRLSPQEIDNYLFLANIYRRMGNNEGARAQAAALVAASPDDPFARVTAGRILARIKDDAAAMKEFDRAIAIKPEGYIYLNRAISRAKTDLGGRLADLTEALRLDPSLVDAGVSKAKLMAEVGDRTGAIASIAKLIAANPNEIDPLVQRGILLSQMNQVAPAEKDFAAARALATDSSALNSMCWSKATAGVALESALADCTAALAKSPSSAAALDSKGLVLLRLGRIDDAIKAYDAALAIAPTQTASLYGRGIAWRRKGDQAKADADISAAIKVDDTVAVEFAEYGVKP